MTGMNTSTTLANFEEQQEDNEAIRTSSLSSSTMHLTGHKGSVYSLSFSPDGSVLASGSFDMTCLLWSYGYNCENFNALVGHKNAILDVKFGGDSDFCATASADHTLGYWDVCTGERIKKLMGHEGVVNACDTSSTSTSHSIIASVSDDCMCKIWDTRLRGRDCNTQTLRHDYQVTSVAYDGSSNKVYTAGIDNMIHVWDIRNDGSDSSRKVMSMKGHTDTITGLSLSPGGEYVLSNSMDGTMRSWDVRPFVDGGQNGKRLLKTFVGGTHNAERGLLNCSWSADGNMVSGGSADRIVHIWDEISSEELYYLPGHKGSVNCVIFHPKENVVASGSSDKTIFLGELES